MLQHYFFILLMNKILFFFIIYSFTFLYVFADVHISEVMPNTIDDKNLEYIELFNSWEENTSLSWYILSDLSWKEFVFWSWMILSTWEKHKYFRPITKITLNNSDEKVFLHDRHWILVSSISYDSSEKWVAIEWNIEAEWNVEWEEEEIIIYNSIPSVQYTFQSPSYITNKQDKTTLYYCDKNREECRVNLDFRASFTWWILREDYECKIDFWEIEWGWSDKCNPSTFSVPSGIYEIKFYLLDKSTWWTIKEKILTFINKNISQVSERKKQNTLIQPIKITKPKIIIESWLNNENQCSNRRICRVNFRYAEKSKYEKCRWDFWWGKYELWQQSKCNPWSVVYWTGSYEVKLRVYARWDFYNFSESKFNINSRENKSMEKRGKEVKIWIPPPAGTPFEKGKNFEKNISTFSVAEWKMKEKEIENISVQSNIILQGRLWKNKTLQHNKLICYESCSVNFDGSLSTGEIERYSWDFWNGNRFEWKNPWYIKYENPGQYMVYLLTEWKNGTSDLKNFLVEFVWDESEEIEQEEIVDTVQERKDTSKNKIIETAYADDIDSLYNNQKDYSVLLYILIWIFSLILLVLILRKEKLL